MIKITDTFYGSSLFTLSGRFPDSQITESFHKIKTDTTSMLQQFMNVVSEIFPDTLWQPDSAFSHIYAMTYYNPAFSVYSGRNRSGISPDSLSHYHTQNLRMIMFT